MLVTINIVVVLVVFIDVVPAVVPVESNDKTVGDANSGCGTAVVLFNYHEDDDVNDDDDDELQDNDEVDEDNYDDDDDDDDDGDDGNHVDFDHDDADEKKMRG